MMNVKKVRRKAAAMAVLPMLLALSASAAGVSGLPGVDRVQSNGHTFVMPAAGDVSHTLLSDGRLLELHGSDGVVYLVDGDQRQAVRLPEVRRLGSVTVMPSGEVLLWGGVDTRGRVLQGGEWFNPTTQHFVHTGDLGLPARAGHTLSVLTDGRLLMAGGWSPDGTPATTAVLWNEVSRQTTVLPGTSATARIAASAILQADGAVRIEGGVDNQGRAIAQAWEIGPGALRLSDAVVSKAPMGALVAETLPTNGTSAASIHGPLVLHFVVPMDVRQLNNRTVTLLGPEGIVAVRVAGVEGGRLAFVQLPNDLYPGSRYTLFVKGLHSATGEAVPFTTVGFTTANTAVTGVIVAGRGGRPAPALPEKEPVLSPLNLMAGGSQVICKDDQLCRPLGFIHDGAWYPGKNNAPDSTGAHWRLYAPYQQLPDTHGLEASLPQGSTVLIGQVRQIDETPVANVEVSIAGVTARTDKHGLFVLEKLAPGRHELYVDGGTANHGTVKYGRFVVGADVKAGTVSHMPFVMYLPRIQSRDEIKLPAPTTREVVLTHPDMPGLELHIPAGAVFKDHEGHVLTHIALVPTPVDHAPFPLPDNFPMYFTIQPGDAVVQGLTPEAAQGIRVVYPNYGHAKPASEGSFWVYGAKDGWQMYGHGHVTADANHLAPDAGVTLAWALGAGASQDSSNPPTPKKPDNCTTGEPIDLQTGILFHEWNDLSVQDVLPLHLTRAYTSADPRSHAFGLGGNSNFGLYLYNPSGAAAVSTSTLVLPCGEGIEFNLVSGAATWPFPAGTVWEHTGTNSAFYGATLQFLNDNTTDGAHWIVTRKDGMQYAFTRHAPNLLSQMRDRFGNKIQFNYNGGLLQQAVSPSGRTLTFNYDTGNRIASVTDNSGRAVVYSYNSAGSLVTVTYPDTTTERYTYDSNNRLLTMQDRRGTVWVTNQYDANGRVTKQTYADKTSNQFAYTTDGNNKVTSTLVTDPSGNQENVVFDRASGYPSSYTLAYGTTLAKTTTFVREASGLVDSTTDALGRTTSYTYDGLGNVLSLTKLAGTFHAVTTKFTYTSDYSQLASIIDPLGHETQLNYSDGCLTKIVNPLGSATTIECNAAGQTIAVKDAMSNTSFFAYQGYDLQSITDPLGRTVSFAVDALGRRTASRDALGNVTLTRYDVNDRVAAVTDALNQTTSVAYDGNGNATTVTLPNQGVISVTYDGRNRPSTRTDALKQIESQTYDGLGNVLTHTDRKGQTTDYSYDALNRRTLVAYADGSGTQATYDAGDRLINLLDSAAGSTSWSFDDLDRPLSESSSQGTISYTYDAASRRISMTPAAQAIVSYSYDNANRLNTISQGSESVQFAYDADDRRTMLKLPNGIVASYGYDQVGQLTSLQYAQANGTVVGSLAYGYDGNGRRVSKSGTFAMDTMPTPTTLPAIFDLNDREVSFNSSALRYDANGNLISDGTNIYTWNARNQLTQVSQGSNVLLAYSYDGMGRRITKTVSGDVPIQYLYDGLNAVQETQGAAINPVFTGLGIDERFARNDFTGRTYFLTDALNSTIALTDPTGVIREQYSYDPYGNVTLSDATSGFTNPYQYTGREVDSPGLFYYRARYYSPILSGFISEDPIGFAGGQPSFYAYVGGDPLNYIDPLGLSHFGPGAHGPLDPSSQNLMQCMDACTHRDLCITSGNDGTHSGPTDPHFAGQAMDIGKNSNPGLSRGDMQQCFTQCTSQNPSDYYGQEEGNHFHLQTRPGRGGASGFAPGVH